MRLYGGGRRAAELGVERAGLADPHHEHAGAVAYSLGCSTLPGWLTPLPDAAEQRALDSWAIEASPGSG